jgi:excisionase family DNA binding protein
MEKGYDFIVEPQLFSVIQAARYLGVSVPFVFARLRAGTIHGVKMGRHWKISIDELARIKAAGLPKEAE